MTATIPVQQVTYRDQNNVLCRARALVLDGKLKRPTNVLGYVWGPKEWVGLGIRYSRKEIVFEFNGQQYRFGSKMAKPLVLAKGENLEPLGFSGNDTNCYIP